MVKYSRIGARVWKVETDDGESVGYIQPRKGVLQFSTIEPDGFREETLREIAEVMREITNKMKKGGLEKWQK